MDKVKFLSNYAEVYPRALYSIFTNGSCLKSTIFGEPLLTQEYCLHLYNKLSDPNSSRHS